MHTCCFSWAALPQEYSFSRVAKHAVRSKCFFMQANTQGEACPDGTHCCTIRPPVEFGFFASKLHSPTFLKLEKCAAADEERRGATSTDVVHLFQHMYIILCTFANIYNTYIYIHIVQKWHIFEHRYVYTYEGKDFFFLVNSGAQLSKPNSSHGCAGSVKRHGSLPSGSR